MQIGTVVKRTLAALLAMVMLFGMAACGKQEAPQEPQQQAAQAPTTGDLSREDMELIVDLIGNDPSAGEMTDEELKQKVDALIGEVENSEIVNLGNQENLPVVDDTGHQGDYDENGAMNKPFDQVYPELIEKEQVTFSGESILIKLKKDTLTDSLKAAGIGALEQIVPMDGCAWYEALLVEGSDAEAALAAVRELDEVLLAEYNYEITTAEIDHWKDFDHDHRDDFDHNGHHKDQWHHHHCGIPDGFDKMETEGGLSSVVVAVIDTGVDYNHEDLKDNIWYNAAEIPGNNIDDDKNGYVDDYYGIDLIAGKGSAHDDNGHGTHVAGIIAARNNNVGVMGIAYGVKIMPIKAAMHNGTLNQADIAKAVLYAYEMGAEVVNMSFGGTACSIAVQDALATAYTRCVLVASAGNNGMPNQPTSTSAALPNYPAALTYVLGVMSVDETGRESVFTNWDAKAFNGVEYELYAPGENIMSTLPGNRYGFLSGTSMAAPMVSAFAAILRSEFTDRDKYPTKFIYGQLAATSDYHADCLDPQLHGNHNLPQIVNLDAALTKLPKPEVDMQDFYIFDSVELSKKNNGDGVIDAGETIALGLTLQNRWGMSENTMVTVDTLENGISDPYVTIVNPTVDYGSVGTYSTGDCGKIYTDELFTGWKNPFIIKIADNCPNDYRMTFHVSITCGNALDETDTAVYSSQADIDLTARHGVILPSIIEEDMVLTKDNLYIIPNATVIQNGTTVRVEPGTHIQFWSDDPNDPYADSYIAYLVVNGRLLVEGSKEEPVYIYPSQLMDHYGVEIDATDTGYVSLKYADITNFFNREYSKNRISYAERCTFRNNYSGSYRYRYLNNGQVHEGGTNGGTIGSFNAIDCVFYKLAFQNDTKLYGTFDRCIFTDCGIDYQPDSRYRNCVFLGNSMVDQTNPNYHMTSSMNRYSANALHVHEIYYRPETGTTYLRISNPNALPVNLLAEALGLENLSHAVIEDDEELLWLWNTAVGQLTNTLKTYSLGLEYDVASGQYVWSDGSAIGDFIDPQGLRHAYNRSTPYLYLFTNLYSNIDERVVHKLSAATSEVDYWLYELPGLVIPTDITFSEYTVDMDMETTYQLQPQNTPVQLPSNAFLYESSDETVLTVSNTGFVTPVGLGTADVWVWSLDRALKNRVSFTVKDYVPLETMTFPVKQFSLAVGETAYAKCILTPVDTTRRNVTYTSSDPSVVTVDNGLLTALGKGSATITATCEELTAVMQVNTWVRATSWSVDHDGNQTVESCNTALPVIIPTPANADLDLQWTSDNENILTVEDGKLILKKAGETYLRVTDRNSGLKTSFYYTVRSTAPVIGADVLTAQLSEGVVALPAVTLAEGAEASPVWEILDPAVAELTADGIALKGAGITTLRVTDPRNRLTDEISLYVTAEDIPRVAELASSEYNVYARLENGDLYGWHAGYSTFADPVLICQNVKAFCVYDCYLSVIQQDNTVSVYLCGSDLSTGSQTLVYTTQALQEQSPVAVTGFYTSNSNAGNLYVLTEDGTVYALGYNGYGCLGIGSTTQTTEFTKVLLNEPVKQIAYNNYVGYYLTENNNLYVSGGQNLQAATPIMIARNVTWLDDGGEDFVTNNCTADFSYTYTEPKVYEAFPAGYTMLDQSYGGAGIALKDGSLYHVRNGNVYSSPYLATRSEKVVAGTVIYNSGSPAYFALTDSGLILANGKTYNGAFLGMTNKENVPILEPVFLPVVQSAETLNLVQTNLDENSILTEDVLTLRMNKQLHKTSATIYENGTLMVAHTEYQDEFLHINPTVGFVEGAVYQVVVSAADTIGLSNVTLTDDLVVEFTYQAPVVEDETVPEETVPEETVPEETLPDAPEEEQVVYTAILDESIERYLTIAGLQASIDSWKQTGKLNEKFYGNAILNPISTDFEVSHWLRLQANTISVGNYQEILIGGNWWGSTNEEAIGLQMIDYADFPNYARYMYAPYLTEAPEDTFPFVTSVKLINKYGEEVTTVGNEEVTFRVTFNRDMDTSIPLQVRFGSAYPYGDYEVTGKYVNPRTWEAVYTLNTLIENGNQYFTIANGCSATEDLPLQTDRHRFGFVIDTTAAQALIMQGTATETGIDLRWTQDDFDTLMGYNVYRSTKEDGLYTRLNSTVIPAETMTYFDDTVEPGVIYYYNFTVVKTDLTESEPSGKIVIMSKDTMAPNIYHSPVANAFTGANLVLSATVTDNLNIAYANLYYRVTGTDSWQLIRMNALNDKYSAIIHAEYVTVAGIEYYIEAFDGVSYTYKGSADAPYTIAVQEAVDVNALGDVDGDGTITNLDALLLLYAINDKYNMTAEEFARADLNGDGELWAAEALRILQYVSGVVGSVKM